MTIRKPMLAEKYVESKLDFSRPYLASFKVDGFRCYIDDSQALTRSGKPMPNPHVRQYLSRGIFDGLDGELVCGDPNRPETFDETSSLLRRKSGEPEFTFLIFDDRTNHEQSYQYRMHSARNRALALQDAGYTVRFLEQVLITSLEELAEFETRAIESGYEGVILRRPDSPYKFGRSTVDEEYLLKVKRRESREAMIVGFEERMLNENEAFTDELGKTKRSTKAEGRVPSGMVGAVIMRHVGDWKDDFKVGAGKLTHDKRREMWENQDKYIGQQGTYSFLPHGDRPTPREGVFHGVRAPEDMS